jgi:hypothetical protein
MVSFTPIKETWKLLLIRKEAAQIAASRPYTIFGKASRP